MYNKKGGFPRELRLGGIPSWLTGVSPVRFSRMRRPLPRGLLTSQIPDKHDAHLAQRNINLVEFPCKHSGLAIGGDSPMVSTLSIIISHKLCHKQNYYLKYNHKNTRKINHNII